MQKNAGFGKKGVTIFQGRQAFFWTHEIIILGGVFSSHYAFNHSETQIWTDGSGSRLGKLTSRIPIRGFIVAPFVTIDQNSPRPLKADVDIYTGRLMGQQSGSINNLIGRAMLGLRFYKVPSGNIKHLHAKIMHDIRNQRRYHRLTRTYNNLKSFFKKYVDELKKDATEMHGPF